MKTLWLLVVVTFVFVACSNVSDPGEACDVPGGTRDVCDDGHVCAKPSDKSNAIVCMPICFEGKQCPKDYDCKGVDGTSLKACRFKD
jgi:hypothetical protein